MRLRRGWHIDKLFVELGGRRSKVRIQDGSIFHILQKFQHFFYWCTRLIPGWSTSSNLQRIPFILVQNTNSIQIHLLFASCNFHKHPPQTILAFFIVSLAFFRNSFDTEYVQAARKLRLEIGNFQSIESSTQLENNWLRNAPADRYNFTPKRPWLVEFFRLFLLAFSLTIANTLAETCNSTMSIIARFRFYRKTSNSHFSKFPINLAALFVCGISMVKLKLVQIESPKCRMKFQNYRKGFASTRNQRSESMINFNRISWKTFNDEKLKWNLNSSANFFCQF